MRQPFATRLLSQASQALIILCSIVLPLQWAVLRPGYDHGISPRLLTLASYWYEIAYYPLIAAWTLWVLWQILRRKSADRLLLLALALFWYAAASHFWADQRLGDSLVGLRFFIPLVGTVILARASQMHLAQLRKPLRATLSIVLALTLLQLTSLISSGAFAALEPLALTPRNFVTDQFPQMQASFTTPNVFGVWLILAAGLLALVARRRSDYWIISLASLASLSSHSRTALMSTVAILGTYCLTIWKHARRLMLGISVAILVIVPLLLSSGGRAEDVVTHGASSTVRVESYPKHLQAIAIQSPAQFVLGHGIGTAGPGSFSNRTHGATIQESWYLQLQYELGFLGLLGFLALVWLSWHHSKQEVRWLLIAGLLSGTFLHLPAEPVIGLYFALALALGTTERRT
jgi:hypothetical protein